jgi:hypothetical protein
MSAGDNNMQRDAIRPAVAVAVLAAGFLSSQGAVAQANDPVIFSFATVGDNRQDPKSPDPTTLVALSTATSPEQGAYSVTGGLLAQDALYLQNSAAWGAIQQGIESEAPQLLFFNGDMIYGYGRPILPSAWVGTTTTPNNPSTWKGAQNVYPDAIWEYMQYAYWRGTVSTLFGTGTYVIPVPGNHETQCSYSATPYSSSNPNPNCNTAAQGNLTGKTAYAENENAFRAHTHDLVDDLSSNIRFSQVTGFYALSPNGLTATTAPVASTNNGPITSDQHDLSYSFDIQAQSGTLLHFAVINTDPAGADSTAPADWLAADFAAAKGRGATNFFVFGHKPAFTYNYALATGGSVAPGATNPGPGGLDANLNASNVPAYRNAFWSVIVEYGATYFSGHEHTVNVAQYPDPTGTYTGSAYQVIVGSGGSPFDDKLVGTCTSAGLGAQGSCAEPVLTNPWDRYYAWALVQVHASGHVSLSVQGFSDTALTLSYPPIIQDLSTYDVARLQ